MKFTTVLLALSSIAATSLAAKVCTPSFDYCADELVKKGFTEADLKAVLNGTEFANDDLKNILFHCKNPGDVGHPKLCQSGCQDTAQEGSKNCLT
ncbi:hypothetical protein P175DRAFT_0535121 [Aspergillus ochraceoroseus IBT 24754]|uniref:Fungal calcium binding protein domain-containing protein n=1 Tax=Aspergillus ochraceoroseus IBT 24754 TaxID=1392256 RepID=A0A2T5LPK0_9EURO|nr:uncharacterized protein P175DRAFT_0535121 [Aspergillus ochraceoroseus IBT 24754]PTU18209.1 hypothetical protein P175DRAFT_0535121 [Aspergillus ochraceoroseus IBT 24754]